MDKTTQIDPLIANQAKFTEILIDFNGSESSAILAKHAILFEAHNNLKAQHTSQQLNQCKHKVINKYWEPYCQELSN